MAVWFARSGLSFFGPGTFRTKDEARNESGNRVAWAAKIADGEARASRLFVSLGVEITSTSATEIGVSNVQYRWTNRAAISRLGSKDTMAAGAFLHQRVP